jgi:hypothetical protein
MSGQSSGKPPAAAFLDEAKSHIRDVSATHRLATEWTRWLRVSAVSGLECVQVLQAAGFRIQARPPGCIEVLRDQLTVQVSVATQLAPDVLVAVMLKAGIGPKQFLDILGRMIRDGM